MTDEISRLQEENGELHESLLEMKCRSMKYNLLFSGIAEADGENCENVLKKFLQDELQIEKEIPFANVHRVGKKVSGKCRAIVAKFIYNKDLVSVKVAAKRLKGKKFWINEQYPPEIEERRRKLYPIAKQERMKKSKVVLVRDKLYVNGKLVVCDEDSDTDEDLGSTPLRSTSRPNKRSRHYSTPNRD
ncbi:hypothetical protein FSP39_002677 [Pinctada imbricata]|uniref:Uncharacterized protein n=1 Tax=Pinctada imbricata TaxID=66713 RepID=A0AA88YGH2_PINIB|nr:hypothetical protein FSP39_002677 [Pinctada imbricata]